MAILEYYQGVLRSAAYSRQALPAVREQLTQSNPIRGKSWATGMIANTN